MNEEMNPQPESAENPTSTMYYEDIKYPLVRRGMYVPAAMQDYIDHLESKERVTTQEIEAIRQEMKNAFTQSGKEVPRDFDENFDKWFL